MNDWPEVFRIQVQPVLDQHAQPVPRAVLGVAAGLVVAGLAILLAAPSPGRFAGLVLVFIVAFGAQATVQKRRAARGGPAWIRGGAVVALRVERFTDSSPVNDATQSRPVHVLELAVAEEGPLTAAGASLGPARGVARLTTSAAIYAKLAVGQQITGVSLPTAPKHLSFLVK